MKIAIYAVVRLEFPSSGTTSAELLEGALRGFCTTLPLIPGLTNEIVRYEIPYPEGMRIYHDADHLTTLHEERMEGAGIFDLDADLPLV